MPDLSELISVLIYSITPAQLLTVLGSIIAVGMGFVLMWFGVRKLIKIFTTALFTGRLGKGLEDAAFTGRLGGRIQYKYLDSIGWFDD